MHYGTFDDENREYVITTPRTPLPWINYLGTEDFHALISNTAGGYCFHKDALHRRILRYRYNNVPADNGGRYFYIREGGRIWSPGWKPVKTDLEHYECRHGLGYTRITGSVGGLSASVLFFVPIGLNGEIHKLTLTNTTREKKQISLYSFVEWCLWNANEDMTNYQRNLSVGEVEIDGSTIYHKTEYRERRNHYAFYHVNQPIAGFDSDRDSFVGQYNGLDHPQVVLAGASHNSVADGWSPIASHRLELTLLPGESRDCVWILGYVENPDEQKWESPKVINKRKAKQMIADYDSAEKVELALGRLKKNWNEHLSRFRLCHADERLSRMVNIWNQYQCMTTFHMARSASYFETGISRGLGFRDTNQDLLGVVHQIPALTRERILDVASTQFADGGCYHQYQPLTKKGNHAVGGNFSDDPLWLIESVAAYLKETGDFGILSERVPFDNQPGTETSLFVHLTRSFRHVLGDRGPHGLPLIKRADWNDCLNLNCFSSDPTDSFQTCTNKEGKVAESVFTAALFVHSGRDYAKIAAWLGEESEAEEARSAVAEMEQVILEHGWDGEWFLRAYDDFGHKVGSRGCAESKIFIEPQGLCAMAGVGLDKGYPTRALDAVREHLATPYGIVLNAPAYQGYHLHLGEISSYPEGYKENGGIFCHNNPWIMIGETVIGRGDQAFDYYQRICPAFLQDISELHRTEPYVYSQMIAGKEARRHGEAKNSWLTGTAAWNFVAITQHILGIQPEFDGLRVEPCIPRDWKEYSVRRRFRGDTYLITVRNPEGQSKGVRAMKVDGKKLDGNLVPLIGDGQEHVVEVWL